MTEAASGRRALERIIRFARRLGIELGDAEAGVCVSRHRAEP
jgi:hypothetical protein